MYLSSAPVILLSSILAFAVTTQPSANGIEAIRRFSATWNSIKSYECTIRAHEVKGSHVQDRVYHLIFSKPSDTRVQISDGDGKGSELVWRGGSTVRAHRGGLLKGIKVTLDLHSHLVTSIRGTTVADINFGALLRHLESFNKSAIKQAVSQAESDSTDITVTILPADPKADAGVSKETYVLRPDGLPVEIDDFAGTTLVKRIDLSEIKINVEPAANTFSL